MKTIILSLLIFCLGNSNVTGASPEKLIYKNNRPVAVFESNLIGLPNYLIFKENTKTFEMYSHYDSWIGTYEVKGDTLTLNKNYILNRSSIETIDKSQITIFSIPYHFLIKDDELMSIMKFEEEYPDLGVISNKGWKFVRVKFEE